MRNPKDESKTSFLKRLPNAEGNLSFFSGELNVKGSYDEALKGADGVVICALPETPSGPELIETVRGGVEEILRACTEFGVKSVVITSSGATVNPKEGEPDKKNELLHFSDAGRCKTWQLCLICLLDFQISQGKYSPAAKTLMEKAALAYAEKNPGKPKLAVLIPNLIVGK